MFVQCGYVFVQCAPYTERFVLRNWPWITLTKLCIIRLDRHSSQRIHINKRALAAPIPHITEIPAMKLCRPNGRRDTGVCTVYTFTCFMCQHNISVCVSHWKPHFHIRPIEVKWNSTNFIFTNRCGVVSVVPLPTTANLNPVNISTPKLNRWTVNLFLNEIFIRRRHYHFYWALIKLAQRCAFSEQTLIHCHLLGIRTFKKSCVSPVLPCKKMSLSSVFLPANTNECQRRT